MNKAVIFDPYAFISFACCTHFLDAGMKVIGIKDHSQSNDFFSEEKQLFVGRNANYKEVPFTDWRGEFSTVKKSFVVISVYDDYMGNEDRRLNEKVQLLGKWIEEGGFAKSGVRLIIFLPISFLTFDRKIACMEEMNRIFNELKKECPKNGYQIQKIFLPSVYGPWQPNHYYFHQVMRHHLLKKGADSIRAIQVPTREHTADAVYIHDLVKTVMELKPANGISELILTSKRQHNTWQKGIEWLEEKGFGEQLRGSRRCEWEDISSISTKVVQPFTPIQKGMKRQQSQLKQLLSHFREN